MKVYIVYRLNYDGDLILRKEVDCVFSTLEKAMDYIKDDPDSYDIEDFDVDCVFSTLKKVMDYIKDDIDSYDIEDFDVK